MTSPSRQTTRLFHKATKQQSKLRLALSGPSGSGKSYSALAIATHLGNSVALIDTEHGSASKYAHLFEFDTCELHSYHPRQYIQAIHAAEQADYEVLIIDSLSHAWMGRDGALELVDRATQASQSGNSYFAWNKVTPIFRDLIETILSCRCHVIATMRSKTGYVIETNDKGKSTPRKIGLALEMRPNIEYEFDVVGEMDLDNTLTISNSRCSDLSGAVINKPGEEVALAFKAWLDDGVPATPKINRDQVIQQTSEAMQHLGWSSQDGKRHLEDTYGKSSRQFLTDEELTEFLRYLSTAVA